MNRVWWTGATMIGLTVLTLVVFEGTRRWPGATLVVTAGVGSDWQWHLAVADRAADRGDISRAIWAWRDAYGAALGSRRWEPMFTVGEAALRIGQAAGTRAEFVAKARQCYLTALFRARHEQSMDGVLRVAEAFADLGDHDVAAGAAQMAEGLTHRVDQRTPERLGVLRRWLDGRSSWPAET